MMQEQAATKVKVEEIACAPGAPVTVLRFSGDITSTSQAVVLGTYEGLPETAKRILLDFSKVEYLNSSGIALVIQMMIAAGKQGQTVQTFGLTPHFQKVFTMVGITKYCRPVACRCAACSRWPLRQCASGAEGASRAEGGESKRSASLRCHADRRHH